MIQFTGLHRRPKPQSYVFLSAGILCPRKLTGQFRVPTSHTAQVNFEILNCPLRDVFFHNEAFSFFRRSLITQSRQITTFLNFV
jgi:hypothetical protein